MNNGNFKYTMHEINGVWVLHLQIPSADYVAQTQLKVSQMYMH